MREEYKNTRGQESGMVEVKGALTRPESMPKDLWRLCLTRHGKSVTIVKKFVSTTRPGFAILKKDGSHEAADIVTPDISDLAYGFEKAMDTMRELMRNNYGQVVGAATDMHYAVSPDGREVFPCVIMERELHLCCIRPPTADRVEVWKMMVIEWITAEGVSWEVIGHNLRRRTMDYSRAHLMGAERRKKFELLHHFPLLSVWRDKCGLKGAQN